MAKKTETKLPVKPALLSKEDREELTKQAQKSVAEEMTQDARDAYFAEQVAAARRAEIPADQMVQVTIDTAPYVPFIMLDMVQFYNGYTYEVPRKQACVLWEQMQRSWHHQDEIDGRRRSEQYRRPQDRRIGPQHAGTITRGSNGVLTAEV